ncbi:DHH family phosphoesterase [Tetragenococcus muriaticus]|uniref:DHH family phosphoesterase n=1 Tax=Tetragenococcus muriaticus TaxID=64642 RepID=UPI00041F2AAC|nr:bifunctional oligoribonuclease/PAP phosphatase NrnA [Tetragenococcus muriaticus]GMA45993.1 oligoribonuclease [Tetragenococcus muriaticus]GMA46218.1 oligoribonuclease [Tetragenococcus muriaticus]GMA48524.1 oligoribonuclease [Tetragenococcus muriaticus]
MSVQANILAEIKAYETIIIHRHQRPDPDAIGSQVGLAELLRASFPEKNIYQVGGATEGLGYLAHMQEVDDATYQGALVIVTDTANAPRISDERFAMGDKLIKIDHHPNEEPYGDLMWVQAAASSCSEIIAEFWQLFPEELHMTKEAARLLYAGIVGDTGRFLYPASSPHTLRIAADLIDFGFDYAALNRQIEQISRNVARLSGYVYENLQIDPSGAAYVTFSTEMLENYGVSDAQTSGVVPLPGTIENVLAWAIFVQQPEGYYRVRMRSKGPAINGIAKRYHGGGHDLASGANVRDLEEAQKLYEEIQKACIDFPANN